MLLRKNFGLLTLVRAYVVMSMSVWLLCSREALDLHSRLNGFNLAIGG